MKSFISIKIALLPFVLFWLASGLGYPLSGALTGAVLAAVALAYRVRNGGPLLLESVALAVLLLLALLHATPLANYEVYGVAWSFIALGGACAASVCAGRPWTGAYVAPAWPGIDKSPLFQQINRLISSLWAAV